MTKTNYCYINNKFSKNGKISIFDLGLLRSFGVVTSLRSYYGKPFHLNDHIKRLHKSSKEIGLTIKKKKEEIEEIIKKLFELNNLTDGNITIILTGGISVNPFIFKSLKPTFIILITPIASFPKNIYLKGIKTETLSIERFLPECKTLNYLPGIVSLQKAKEKGIYEIIYTNKKNQMLEGISSNFFAIKNNHLITPDKEILKGITRSVILDIAKKDFIVEQRDVSINEITEFDECFISGSIKEIIPVIKINNKKIGKGIVGEKTSHIINLFKNYTKEGNF
jgi:branched-subunit amino acid aminotransferase/4-amino-4-deoxychorismate lyase